MTDELAQVARARERYPFLPAKVRIEESPATAVWVADFTGLEGDVAVIRRRAIDPLLEPLDRNLMHELAHGGHALQRAAAGQLWFGQILAAQGARARADDPFLAAFWQAMAYTTSLEEACARFSTHDSDPIEQLAEAFAYIACPELRPGDDGGIWTRYGGQLDARRPQLNEFFRRDVAATGGSVMPNATFVPDPAGYLLSFPITRPFADLSLPQFGFHTGIDLGIPQSAAVPAVKSGIVFIDDDDAFYDERAPATWSGVSVWIRDDDGEEWIYAHLARNTVMGGQRVVAGDVVGFCGETGAATGPHLHLERRVDGIAVDPYEEVVMLSNTAKAEIREIVADEVGKAGRSIETKIDAGFNVTLVTIARRLLRSLIFIVRGTGSMHDPAGRPDPALAAPVAYADDATPVV